MHKARDLVVCSILNAKAGRNEGADETGERAVGVSRGGEVTRRKGDRVFVGMPGGSIRVRDTVTELVGEIFGRVSGVCKDGRKPVVLGVSGVEFYSIG